MRSSTLRRSNLTREKIAMLQAIANYTQNGNYTDYYQNDVKDKELDVLWQSVKSHAKASEKSVIAYFTTGFFAGVIVTLIMTTLISCLVNYSSSRADDFKLSPKEQKMEKIALEPADTAVAAGGKFENYEVKSGDTLAAIVMRFYGIYSIDKMDAIQKANGMKSPNELSIGQKLIIPLD
ncbi:LysM peptidoglycan-binding domain-containing protein [bacterium]|nr:LysM peptidoglycan-binding domain-containing protein [bacterium]